MNVEPIDIFTAKVTLMWGSANSSAHCAQHRMNFKKERKKLFKESIPFTSVALTCTECPAVESGGGRWVCLLPVASSTDTVHVEEVDK